MLINSEERFATVVAAQREFFRGIGGVGREFGEPGGLRAVAPERVVCHGVF